MQAIANSEIIFKIYSKTNTLEVFGFTFKPSSVN